MQEIKNYRPHKSCQIDLDDGTKVLLSFGKEDIKLFELGFLGISKNTIHTFDITFYSRLLKNIGYDLEREEVKELSEDLIKANDVPQLIEICKEIEEKSKLSMLE